VVRTAGSGRGSGANVSIPFFGARPGALPVPELSKCGARPAANITPWGLNFVEGPWAEDSAGIRVQLG